MRLSAKRKSGQAGYNPELSYGSHIFQDLVEAEILYTAVFHSEKTLHFAPEKLKNCPDITGQFDDGEELSEIVHVYASVRFITTWLMSTCSLPAEQTFPVSNKCHITETAAVTPLFL